MKTGIELIAEERQRQIEKEGWTQKHDGQHSHEELAVAAACYAINKSEHKLRVQIHLPAESWWESGNTGDRGDRQLRGAGWRDAFPFEQSWDKRNKHDRLKSLVIAGALIAAEIDRLKQPSNK